MSTKLNPLSPRAHKFFQAAMLLALVAVVVTLISLLIATAAGAAEDGVSGAVWTTTFPGCQVVNGNPYETKQEVGLNGGPKNKQDGNLTDGFYAVNVHSPDGILLGTSVSMTNPTPIQVLDGKFVSCYRLWDLVQTPDGIQGYLDTTNQGGEYKVTISMSLDFDPSASKSDNFKVKKPTSVGLTCAMFATPKVGTAPLSVDLSSGI